MNLLFIYGPPAVGKLTVANEISKQTGYKVFHNHLILNSLRVLFPYDDPDLNPIRRRLGRKFRLEIFEEAAKANVNFITTFGMSGVNYFDFFDNTISTIEKNNGKIMLVQLITTKEVLLKRVLEKSRKDLDKINTKVKMEEMFEKHPDMLEPYPNKDHLKLDVTNLDPKNAAEKIIDYYKII